MNLEQIKKIKTKRKFPYSQEEMAISIAWWKDKVTLTQAAKGLKKANSNCYRMFAICLKEARNKVFNLRENPD